MQLNHTIVSEGFLFMHRPSTIIDTPLRASAATRLHASITRERLACLCILGMAALLRFMRLDQQGLGNLYYAASVQSMLHSWHNFWFVAFDQHGFLAVDKPPLGLWVQVLSVRLFGWSGWSLRAPQALAGTLSVGILFVLVRRAAGTRAGLLAALVQALMPIAVATDRNNTMDSLLVLVLLLSIVCAERAISRARWQPLMLAAVCIGAGMLIKMLQAVLIVPALGMWYLLAAPFPLRARLWHLVLAGVVVAGVAIPWMLTVDLTPAANRPFIASSTNSELELLLGHNGAARIQASSPRTAYVTDEIGTPGPLRLWQAALGGQATWLLPLALIGLGGALHPAQPQRIRRAAALWGIWLMTDLLFFSAGAKFHRYYLVMLAPPLAALVGIGMAVFWRGFQQPDARRWWLPAALGATLASQVVLLAEAPAWGQYLIPVIALAGTGAIGAIIVNRAQRRWAYRACTAALGALFLAPTLWALTPLVGAHPSQPYAGPDVLTLTPPAPVSARLIAYLRTNQHNTHFLAATVRATTAAPLMLASGAAVMSVGGYAGGDDILTPARFAALVRNNTVRFVLLPVQTPQQPALVAWVTARCTTVPPALWREPVRPDASPSVLPLAAYALWDCQHSPGTTATH